MKRGKRKTIIFIGAKDLRIKVSCLLTILLLMGCNSTPPYATVEESSQILYEPEDKGILESILNQFSDENETDISELMVKVAGFFKSTPYVAHTLETEVEQLVINLREMDCTTFAENCLAISRTIKSEKPSFDKFTSELQSIRYRDGEINGYLSRNHYFCDWIYNNQLNGFISDISEGLTQTPLRKEINFMSFHPDSYMQLKDSTLLIERIAEQEKEISKRKMYYIPESRIAEIEDKLMDGDIVGITTSVKGIAISHVGVLVRESNRIHLLHASSLAEKVILSETTLEEYLLKKESSTGIMVARPL